MRIILGSKSARRKELMELLGFDFIVEAADTDEDVPNYDNSVDYVRQVTLRKGLSFKNKYPDDLVICADTIVCLDDQILGKPKDIDEARKMMLLLSGNRHIVLTGVFLHYKTYSKVFVERTEVDIAHLELPEIEAYIKTNEPYDKAGGYAIQGYFAKYIKGIKGDYYNVMGLPLCRLYQEIKTIETKFNCAFSRLEK
jgi:septum formation protein